MTVRSPFIPIFLIFVVLGIYYPSIFAPFNSVDDIKMINWLINVDEHNVYKLFFPGGSGYYYRPLLTASFWLDKWLWGLQESFMHLGNILVHAGNTLLVYAISGRVSRIYSLGKETALAAALLFALHPLNCEAVNWISGRTDLLAGFFLLSTVLLLIRGFERDNRFELFAAGVTMLLACLVKETAVFFLPAALLMVYATARQIRLNNNAGFIRSVVPGYLAVITSTGVYFWMRQTALSKGDVGVRHAAAQISSVQTDYLYLVRASLKAGGFYLKKLFVPWPLNFGIDRVPDQYVYAGIVLILIIIVLLYRRDLISSFIFAGICIGSSALIVAFGRMAWTPIAERYMYIPTAFIAIGITAAAGCALRRNALGMAVPLLVVSIIGVFGTSTVLRNMVWQDNYALFADTVEKSPGFLPAQNDLAIAMLNKGRVEEARKIIKELKAPNSVKNWEIAELNKASVLVDEGKLEAAAKLIRPISLNKGRYQKDAIEMLLKIDEKLLNGADKQRTEEIRKDTVVLLQSLQQLTGNPFYYYRLGQTHLALRNRAEAGRMFEKAFQSAPRNAHYRDAAEKLARKLKEESPAQ